jgi:hypothetical protein
MKCLTVALLCAAISFGCAFQRQRINVENPFSRIDRVRVGETEAVELPAIMGTAPSSVFAIPPDKEGHVYSYGDSKTWMMGLIIFNVQKTNTGVDTAVFVVDAKGFVEEKIYSRNSKDLPWQFWPFGGE